jgi:hypothetical protein
MLTHPTMTLFSMWFSPATHSHGRSKTQQKKTTREEIGNAIEREGDCGL